MDTRRALLVDAFADEPTGGTRVGVVPDATDLTDDQCRAISGELGASVTAFVRASEGSTRLLQPFTPTSAVDRATHAEVAALGGLAERGVVDDGDTVETPTGQTTVEVADDGTAWIEQPDAEVRSADVTHEEAAGALGIDVAALRDVGADLPIGRVASGRSVLVVPVNYFEHLRAASPDPEAVAELCEREGTEGLYAFTFDTLDGGATAHAREFAPPAVREPVGTTSGDGATLRTVAGDGAALRTIVGDGAWSADGALEVPPSGTAAGGCGAYLRSHRALDGERDVLVFEQGHFLDRPGRVRVRSDGETLAVGGATVTTLDGDVLVPAADDDEIIEAD